MPSRHEYRYDFEDPMGPVIIGYLFDRETRAVVIEDASAERQASPVYSDRLGMHSVRRDLRYWPVQPEIWSDLLRIAEDDLIFHAEQELEERQADRRSYLQAAE